MPAKSAINANAKVWDKAVLLPIDKLDLCDWNCNEMGETELAALVEEVGNGNFDEPLQVVPQSDRYLVIGGEHRLKALKSNNATEAPCVIRGDLANADRAELMTWSVRRNNIRGKINSQKYAELERELVDQHNMAVEAARRSMLINGALAKKLAKSDAVSENEAPTNRHERPDTDGERDTHKDTKKREGLLATLRTAEQDVLLQCSDTLENGYVFFGQQGKLHLLIEETPKLYEMVQKMVAECKGDSEAVDDFLISAISVALGERKK